VCRIRQLLRQPGNHSIRVMAEGGPGPDRGLAAEKPCLHAEIEPLPDLAEKPS
jgi:hypothetical protein